MPRARSPARISSTLLLALVFVCASPPAGAQDEEPDRAGMLVLQPDEADEGDFRALEQALDAHLQRLGIDVRLRPVTEIPEDPREQQEKALRILRLDRAAAVVWLDVSRRTATLIHVDDQGRENRLERRIDCISEDLGRCADAIASVVSSAVSSWAEPVPAAEEAEPREVAYAVDNELTPVELSKPPWKRPDPLVRVSAGAGYGAAFFEGADSAAHGFDVGVWVLVARYLMAEAVFDFFWPLEGRSADIAGWIEIDRWDVAARVGGALPLERFVLSLTLGALFDFAEVEAASEGTEISGAGETRKGFTAALAARMRLTDWLSVWIATGVDALDDDLVYRGTDGDGLDAVLIRCGSIQARLLAGFEIGLGLGAMRGS